MQQKLTRNTFEKGRNTDIDRNRININQYIEAHNVELVGDGTFTALKNIKGTGNVANIIAEAQCHGVFRNTYLINGVAKECLTIFAYTASLFKIWCHSLTDNIVYELFQEAIDSDYNADDRVIDAHSYPENGVDVLYFTDNYFELRKIRCEITEYTPNFLTAFDLSVQRRGGMGGISYNAHVVGALLSGTYQFSYRMVDPATKTLTKWSTPTNGFHVYSQPDSGGVIYAGVGLPTPFGLAIDVTPTSEEQAEFDYFQIAVIENIYPTTGSATTASILPIESISNRLSYEYKANARVGTIPINDINVDLAQIKTGKTLNIKQNKLFFGNIKYTSFDFDNGAPEVTSGSIIKISTSNTASAAFISSTNIGYFRDEVYRFGIVYYDKFGNKSPVKVLDLSNIVDNQISSGLVDMKFPARSFNPAYSLFAPQGPGVLRGQRCLGLRLAGITNHPSWATKFEIVRAKRLKNILFQTPVIPMTTVRGIGALDNYPLTATYNKDSSFDTRDLATKTVSTTPQSNEEILVTRNFFWPDNRSIIRNGSTFGSGDNKTEAGEAKYKRNSTFQYAGIFPQSTMYGDTPFSFTGIEKLDVVDIALLKLNFQSFSESRPYPVVDGDDILTSVTGTFHAVANSQYYFDNANIKSTAGLPTEVPITAYEYFANGSPGGTIAGQGVFKFEDLNTVGIDYGYPPTVTAMGVIKLQNSINEANEIPKTFVAGTLNSPSDGTHIVGSSGPMYNDLGKLANTYVTDYTGYVDNSSYTGAVNIANIKIGLADDRYGPVDTSYEFISTGTSYSFNSTQIEDLKNGTPVPITVDVWGGDCFVGTHTFKVSDSSYSITNAVKIYNGSQSAVQLTSKWNNYYFANSAGTAITLPVALENVGQYIEVVLESEYNGTVRDIDVLTGRALESNVPILGVADKFAIRSPLTYNYNLNLSKQNAQKVYFPKPQFSFEQTDFEARILYSDLKIYNTSEQGFDVFRVLNYYDLEETRGSLTKLAVASDELYAIQARGIIYLPTGQTQLQQTDAGSLSVGTSDTIGRPIVVDSKRGGLHLRGIVETGKVIIIPDNVNKSVYLLAGQATKDIVAETMNNTLFRAMFANQIPEKNILGLYDPLRKEYWLIDNLNFKCEIFNEENGWIGDYEFSSNSKLYGGVYSNQKLYLIGKGTSDSGMLATHEMYTGANNTLMGEVVVPRVVVSVNPDDDFSKTFDNMMFAATDRLASVDVTVHRESSLGNQVVTGMNLASESIEGNYRIKVLLDANDSRLRGLRAITTIKWGELSSALSALYTKYRLSPKTPF